MVITMQRFWNDCQGGILTTELLLVTSVLVGTVGTGLSTFRDAVTGEFSDVAASVSDLNQSYLYSGVRGPASRTAGSDYSDRRDGSSSASACIVMGG